MVARGSSQMPTSVSVQDKGSRNKRKFHSDTPLCDAEKHPLSLPECVANDIEKSHGLVADERSLCDLCGLHQDQLEGLKSGHAVALDFRSMVPKESVDVEEYKDAYWSDITETQLEELVLSNLDTIYKSAIRKIASHGYSEDVAMKAVLRSGLYYGCKDTVSNIVDNALMVLGTGQELDSFKDRIFEDLEQLEKYILAEMVCVLREVRPVFSMGDAMWCLLICDMNMSHACAIDGDLLGNFRSDEPTGNSSVSNVSLRLSETNGSIPIGAELSTSRNNKPSKLNSPIAGTSNLPFSKFSAFGNVGYPEKDNTFFPADRMEESSSYLEERVLATSRSSASRISGNEDKMGIGRKGHVNVSKRDSILRQKSIHLEKNYRAYGSKAALKSGKLNGFSSFFMDKKCRPMSEAALSNLKSASIKISKAVGMGAPQMDVSANVSLNVGSTVDPGFTTKAASKTSALPVAGTDLSLSLHSKSSSTFMPEGNSQMAVSSADTGLSSDMIFRQGPPHDKDEMVLKLLSRVPELQNQMQEWTEWAQHKVMQAARRLSKDKEELKALRLEKEEVARLKKEKQTLEDSTMKKLSEMENALCKASGQVDRANATVRRLEVENSELRQEMEAAKSRAAESAASCQEVARREKKMLKKYKSWERQKTLFQEELVTEKRKLSLLQKQLEQAKEYHDLLEARWRQEEKLKEEAQTQAKSERKEREKIEASAKSKEDAIRLEAEPDLQRYRNDIGRLEIEISQLRVKADSSKIAALRQGVEGSYASCLTNAVSNHAVNVTKMHWLSEMMDFQDSGFGDARRERECVMCLTDEMFVVFLPCAHQVVCIKCNELHEKEGMKDCPSCRTPIQRRVCVRFADS
ncbi:hypothetical protein ACLOJK_025889 [Asimina triloba]